MHRNLLHWALTFADRQVVEITFVRIRGLGSDRKPFLFYFGGRGETVLFVCGKLKLTSSIRSFSEGERWSEAERKALSLSVCSCTYEPGGVKMMNLSIESVRRRKFIREPLSMQEGGTLGQIPHSDSDPLIREDQLPRAVLVVIMLSPLFSSIRPTHNDPNPNSVIHTTEERGEFRTLPKWDDSQSPLRLRGRKWMAESQKSLLLLSLTHRTLLQNIYTYILHYWRQGRKNPVWKWSYFRRLVSTSVCPSIRER